MVDNWWNDLTPTKQDIKYAVIGSILLFAISTCLTVLVLALIRAVE